MAIVEGIVGGLLRGGVREASSRSLSTRRRREGLGSSFKGREFQISSCLGVIRGDEKPLNVLDRVPRRFTGRESVGVLCSGWECDLLVEGGVDIGDEGTRERGRREGVTDRTGDERRGVDIFGDG